MAEQVDRQATGPPMAELARMRAEILAAAASDVDVLVDFEPGRSLLDLAGLLVDLEDLLGHPVDVVTEPA